MGRTELSTDALKGVHVLLVEDDEDSRDLIATVLRYCGALVTPVVSAAAALGTLERVRPDVVLTDISMPEHDGYWLIRALRALPPERGGALPALAMTAHGGTHGVERALAAGFQGHLRKPLDPWELSAAIARLVGRKA